MWVGLRDTPQVPLRGPAQPLAAVRSDACEAMPRKQCVLTHVGSVAPSMALRVRRPTHTSAWTVGRCAWEGPSHAPQPQRAFAPADVQPNTLLDSLLFNCLRHQRTVRRRYGWVGGTLSRMGPTHASDGLGRTPSPGLAERAGLRTRASGDGASRDGFTACPANPPVPTPLPGQGVKGIRSCCRVTAKISNVNRTRCLVQRADSR